ncbi:MAG: helix-turn-helix domain-containing protein [Nanoarchaeota archaeon]|nr:helix-turn-helix domain-containing protein [Nanoarchaeota archaeon]
MLFSSKKPVSTINSDALTQLHKQLKSSFSTVKEEMEEHLQAINENTSEIHHNSDHLAELENRMAKLEERMDDIHLMFKQIMNAAKVSIELSPEEQKVFLILYTHDSFLTAEQLADRFAIPVQTVHDSLLSMSDKGIAIEKEVLNEEDFFKLEDEFRSLQAKQQIVKIDAAITQQYQNKLLKKFFSS